MKTDVVNNKMDNFLQLFMALEGNFLPPWVYLCVPVPRQKRLQGEKLSTVINSTGQPVE